MTTHRITNADDVRTGNALPADRTLKGVPLSNVVIERWTPILGVAAGVSASQTVTGAGTAALINGTLASGGSVTFDYPRNVVGAWTNTAIITITGYDKYGNLMKEVSASGTSHAGKKAFKRVTSVTTSATITGATFGSGDVIGLSYRPVVGGFIRGVAAENTSDAGTYVAPIRTTSTSTSADVRGTYDPNVTLDGSAIVTVMYVAANGPQDTDAFGIAQYAG